VTALGPIALRRVYFACPDCGLGDYALDAALGLEGYLSRQARRMVCAAGGQVSFAKAEFLLGQLCGWSLSDETIRQACYREAKAVTDWRQQDATAPAAFGLAQGRIEFESDATKVNTDTGWRDMKIGIYAKRPLGEPATPADWDRRDLPGPVARLAFAAIETSDVFGVRWRDWAARLGIRDSSAVTVLGDGAEWIWEQARQQLPEAQGVLDIYHALEYLARAARTLCGEGSPEATAWLEQGRQSLLADGWWGLCEHVGRSAGAEDSVERRGALDDLIGYFAKHTGRLNYCQRLYAGTSIGSGMVEGAAKNMIGQRLKQTGACWLVDNVVRMAELCCLSYSDGWHNYWLAI
jgi:hypothetical protein